MTKEKMLPADRMFKKIFYEIPQVYNHFAIDIFVYSAKSNKSKVELCQVGKVNSGQHLNIPVSAVYGSKGQLFFAPER